MWKPLLVDIEDKIRLDRQALEGFHSGPDSQLAATAEAMSAVGSARCVVVVEGVSDQIAVETLAARRGRDLSAAGAVVVPVGGAHAMERYLRQFGPQGAGLAVVVMCDEAEEAMVNRALRRAGIVSRDSLFVCVKDLEDELIRSVDPAAVEALLESQGDLQAFRTLQRQGQWRERPFEAQMHRWLRAGARRNLRYARLLVEVIDSDRVPHPLEAVVAAAG